MLRTLLIVSSLGLFLLIQSANSQIPTNSLVPIIPSMGMQMIQAGCRNNVNRERRNADH